MRIRNLATAFALLLGIALPSLAHAANAFATGNVNLRTGPGTQYARVTTIPVGATVTIRGCLTGYSWCDVNFAGLRGWASSNYLQALYQNRRYPLVYAGPLISVPIIVAPPRPPHWRPPPPRPPHVRPPPPRPDWNRPPRPPQWGNRPPPPSGNRPPRPPRPQPR